MKIIICSNIAGAGKDVARLYLEEKYGFKGFSFADKIYDIARDVFNMNQKNRALLINIGEKMREINPYVWINYTFNIANKYKNVVISDMRKIEEYEAAIGNDFFPIRIVCDRNIAIQRIINRDGICDESLLDHAVETGTREIKMREIDNNGTFVDLYNQIDSLIEDINKLRKE